jgi:intein/homing endonuclease
MSWETGNQRIRKNPFISNEELSEKQGFLEEREAKLLFYQFLRNNITFTTDLITGVKLFPFQHMAVKSMLESDYFLGVWCLEENEYVLTENGFKKIKDIKIGEKVRSRKNLNNVSNKRINPEEEGFEIVLNSGDSFKAKKGHKVLTYQNQEFKFKLIEDLNDNDNLPIKMSTEIWGDLDITDKSRIKRSLYLFYTMGYILGDGWINKDGLHFCSENEEILIAISRFTKENDFNLYSRQRSENLNFYEYSIFNRKLVDWFESIGWNINKKSNDKIICDLLLQAPRYELCALIGGLFDADGYASIGKTNNKVGLKNTSLQLLRQVKMLLNNLGIQSFLRKSGENKGKPYYDLVVANDYESLKKFQESIDFIVCHKKENLNKILEKTSKRNYQNNLVPDLGLILKKEGSFEKVTGKRGNWGKSFSQNEFDKLLNISDKTKKIIEKIRNENIIFSKIKSINNCKVVSIDITVDNEECYIGNGIVHHNSRGMSKSYTTGIFAILDAILNQGIEIGIMSRSFRQSKMIFKKIEDIAAKPEAYLLKQCITHVSKNNDEWLMEIGKSRIRALPLGDGEKLRGFRFHRIIIDEFLLMPERIYNEVIVPFLSVVQNPTQREELYNLETQLIEKGEMKEEDRYVWPNNKLIALSSASFKFEYLYKLYEQYDNLIHNPKPTDSSKRCVMQFSYDCAPVQLYDQNLINQAKSTMSESQFQREFGAQFTDDSSGYFKISKMALCTVPDGETPSVEVVGNPEDEYVIAVDPSWSETEGSDDFAIQVIKVNYEKQMGTLVHSYALAGASLKDHIKYFLYILKNFNVVAICMDYNGGVQFMNSCNESELFKDEKIELKCVTTEFERPEEYQSNLYTAKSEYNKTDYRTVFMRKPTSAWIRQANELLQANFDHRRIYFASRAMDDHYKSQINKRIGIENLKFSNVSDLDKADVGARMIDFVEHLSDMILLTKTECALIQITTSAQGMQNFDLPANLKRKSGPDKPRKDSYSALVLGNWMTKIIIDMRTVTVEDNTETFTPMFIA